ncbi:YicC/YloC family endoribonuclease [Botrimarina sp.]|uniref:YicC/YloC family endoribonuclease n=1 Tax=Botrimarina sp. TaxID=2795802 RepID=UPI0032EDAF7B
MLLSMTGFGEGRSQTDAVSVVAEVRSINNRHLKISYRSSDGYHGLEPRVEALVRQTVRRGTVQVNVRVERRNRASDYRIDHDVLLGYQEQLTQLGGVHSQPTIDKLLTLPGVITTPDASAADPEGDWPAIEAALAGAVEALNAMRVREGEALAKDLRAQAGVVTAELAGVEQRAPAVAEAYRERLAERVGSALDKLGVSLEPSDLAREVALFVDRSDISEETVRLRSHLEQFDATITAMSGPERQEGVGRKLEFIAQEMGREVNTIGSKANDSEISVRVVEMKTALERIREQVQNVE